MFRTRIYYQDTDAGGVVYFANYLKLFEKSWFEYLASLGILLPEWEKLDTFVLVRKVLLDLLDKSQYGDELEVHTSVSDMKNAQFTLLHAIHKNGKIITRGETLMVCVDATGKPKRIPDEFKNRLLHAKNVQ
ncbi:MAG TPA: thioesterase family protein [Syntrophorhabdales bacterium]|nr:thioesterase family protein [Syntrophorhabdales bacterium]